MSIGGHSDNVPSARSDMGSQIGIQSSADDIIGMEVVVQQHHSPLSLFQTISLPVVEVVRPPLPQSCSHFAT